MNFLSSGGRVKVGRKAGVTLGEQWLKIAEGIELLDTPGILPFSKKEEYYWKLALTGAISREKIMPDMILEKYFNEFPGEDLWKGVENLNDFLIMKGKEYSFYASGGIINMEKTARRFLEDLETGKIKRFTLDLPL
jgi:ribosome biogenesis GTPase A